MTTTYTTANGPILAWPPALRPNSVTLYPQANTASFTSPFTRTTQTQALPGALWQLQASFPPLGEAKAAQARALLAQLRGGTGRFYFAASRCGFAIPGQYQAERVLTVRLSADMDGPTADRDDITIDATTTRLESVFVPDDAGTDATRISGTLVLNSDQRPLQVGNSISWDDATGWRHLHMVVGLEWQDHTSGALTIVVEPPMRERPTSATPVHITYPSGIFRLQGDDVGAPAMTPGPYTAITLNAVQAFPLSIAL